MVSYRGAAWLVVMLAWLVVALVGLGCSSSSDLRGDDAGEDNHAVDAEAQDDASEDTGSVQPPPRRVPEPGDPSTAAPRGNGASADPSENDRRVREAMERARYEFERGYYDAAMGYLERVATLQPLSDDVANALRVQANMTRTFQRTLGHVDPLNQGRDMVRVVFHGGGSIEGIVLERGRNTLLLRRYTGGFERVDTRPSNVYAVEVLTREQQQEELTRRFATLEQRFRLRSRSAVEIGRFAREARRYDQREKAHHLLLEAFSLDPWVDESLALEADEDYVAFRHAMQEGERDQAAALLRELEGRYPNAAMFTTQPPPQVSAEPPSDPEPAAQPEPLEEEAVQRIIRDAEEQAEQEAEEARRSVQVDPRAEVPELDELDARQLLRLADRYRDRAKAYERGATPGAADTLEALDKAIYAYRMAQEIYRRALAAGADETLVNPRLTDVNRGLFWARRQRPLD